MVSTCSQYELAYRLSIAHALDDVTWPDDVIMVTSCFFSLKCFFSGNSCQNWMIHEHNVPNPLYGASIWSPRIVDPGVMTSLMTSSCIIIVATLGLNISETRSDSGMVSTDSLYKRAYGLSIAHAPDDVTWPDDVIMVTTLSLNAYSRAVFGGIRWHFNTMLSRTVYLYDLYG